MRRLAVGQPGLAALPALPRAGGEAEDLGLHPAAFQRAREDVRADGGNRDRPPAHRARIVDQQGDDRVLELGIAFDLVAERVPGADDDAGQPRGIEQPLFLVEIPAAVLLRHQPPLQPVGKLGDDRLQPGQLAVEIAAQPVQLLRVAQLGRLDHLVETVGEMLVLEIAGDVGPRAVGADRQHALLPVVGRLAVGRLLARFGLALGLAVGFALARLAGDLGRLRLRLAAFIALALVLVLLAAVLVVALFVLAALVLLRADEFEVAQHVERERLERLLVVERERQGLEIGFGPRLDELAHHVHAGPRAFGHRGPGQPLAQDQAERGLQRDLVLALRPRDRVGRGA